MFRFTLWSRQRTMKKHLVNGWILSQSSLKPTPIMLLFPLGMLKWFILIVNVIMFHQSAYFVSMLDFILCLCSGKLFQSTSENPPDVTIWLIFKVVACALRLHHHNVVLFQFWHRARQHYFNIILIQYFQIWTTNSSMLL